MIEQILLDSNYYIHDSNYPQRTVAYFNLGFNIICAYNNHPTIIKHSVNQVPLVSKVSLLKSIDNSIIIKRYNNWFHLSIGNTIIFPNVKILNKLINE